MQTLKDYIKINYYNFDYISEELKNKLQSYRCRKYGFINEGSGVFNGNNKISKFISDEIRLHINNSSKEIELEFTYAQLSEIYEFENFFNILFVTVKKDNRFSNHFGGEGDYNVEYADEMWDSSNKCFGIISITIIIPQDLFNEYSSCADLVEHELNHAFDDYHRHLLGKSMFYDKSKQQDFIEKNKFDENNKAVIERYLSKSECNAYIAQLESELEGKQFRSSNECIKWLDDNSKAWETYKGLRFYIDMSTNKKLYRMFYKSWNKFINHVSFVIKDHIKSANQIIEKCSRDDWELKYLTKRYKDEKLRHN